MTAFSSPERTTSIRYALVSWPGFGEVGEVEAERGEPLHVGDDHILLRITADCIDPGNPGNGAQKRGDDPVLRGAQIGRLVSFGDEPLAFGRHVTAVGLKAGFAGFVNVVLAMRKPYRPHIDLAEPGRDRPHFRVYALGKVFLRSPQPLRHLLTGEVDIGLLGEDGRDLGEAVAAE